MGNCLRHDKSLAETEKSVLEPEPTKSLDEIIKAKGQVETSFGDESKAVRIKVVVTKEELRRILGYKKGTDSVQHLVHVLRDRSIKISRVREEERRFGNWSPSLESIPEDHQ